MLRFSKSKKFKFNPTTPIQLYYKNSSYVSGQGQSSVWTLIESVTKQATETEEEVKTNIFYCEWMGLYGDRAISAEALGVKDSAIIRSFFVPSIYEKLKSIQTIVVKNADSTAFKDGEIDKENQNVYELWGGIDNVGNENQFIEFRVRRYEGA